MTKNSILDCDSCNRKINIVGNKTIKFLKWMFRIYTRNPTVYMTIENGPTCLICLDERIEKQCNKMRQAVLDAGQDSNELFKLPMP